MPDVRFICEEGSNKWFFDEAHQAVEPDVDANGCPPYAFVARPRGTDV